MVQSVKFAHCRPRVGFVIAKFFFFLLRIGGLERLFGRRGLWITFLQEVFPFFERAERAIGIVHSVTFDLFMLAITKLALRASLGKRPRRHTGGREPRMNTNG